MYPFPFVQYEDTLLERPQNGNYIMASFDEETIIVYVTCKSEVAYFSQAFQPYFLKSNGHKVGDVWEVRTCFASVVQSCNWGKKEGHDSILALTISRDTFDDLIASAIRGKARKRGYNDADYFWETGRELFGNFNGPNNLIFFVRGELIVNICRYSILNVHNVTSVMKDASNFLVEQHQDNFRVPREKIYMITDAGMRVGIRCDQPKFQDIVYQLLQEGKGSKFHNRDDEILERINSYQDEEEEKKIQIIPVRNHITNRSKQYPYNPKKYNGK